MESPASWWWWLHGFSTCVRKLRRTTHIQIWIRSAVSTSWVWASTTVMCDVHWGKLEKGHAGPPFAFFFFFLQLPMHLQLFQNNSFRSIGIWGARFPRTLSTACTAFNDTFSGLFLDEWGTWLGVCSDWFVISFLSGNRVQVCLLIPRRRLTRDLLA